MLKLVPALALAALALPAAAAQAPAPEAYPKRIPSTGGEVVIAGALDGRGYDEIHYAPARRAGDYLYISGVVAGRRPGEGKDVEAYKAQVRRAFARIDATLQAEGLSFADVVMINSFHVWDGPNFDGGKEQQIQAFGAVKDEFMPMPYPAWTAVGTTGLLAETGVAEIQMIAYAPRKSHSR